MSCSLVSTLPLLTLKVNLDIESSTLLQHNSQLLSLRFYAAIGTDQWILSCLGGTSSRVLETFTLGFLDEYGAYPISEWQGLDYLLSEPAFASLKRLELGLPVAVTENEINLLLPLARERGIIYYHRSIGK